MAKKKILVVDDEPDFLALIKIRLESEDYEVHTAINGKEALAMVKADKPDAVLLDILMPDLDGLTVLKTLRSEYKDLPVFMITAFSNEERFEVARNLGASGFIVKTGNLKKEVANVTNILRLSGQYKG